MFRMLRFLFPLLLPLLVGMGEYPVGTAVTLVPVAGTTMELDPRLLGRWRIPSDGKRAPITLELHRSKTLIDRYEVEIPLYFARPVEGRLVRLSEEDKEGSVLGFCRNRPVLIG